MRVAQKPLNQGFEGRVHKVQAPSQYTKYCVKLYKDPDKHQREKKLRFMVAKPPSELEGRSYRVCWPKESVYQGRQFSGFLMPLAHPQNISLYQLCTPRLRSSIKNKSVWEQKFDRSTGPGVLARLKLCVNIAVAVHTIHKPNKYVIVDLKPQNILVSPAGEISLIDLDSIQINNGAGMLFPGPVATPEYVPPEAYENQDGAVTKAWDNFALAVVFYQILFGLHPYAGSPKGPYQDATTIGQAIKNRLFVHGTRARFIDGPALHQNFERLPQDIRRLFLLAFDAQPGERPTAETWGKTLFHEIEQQEENVKRLAQHVPPPPPPPRRPPTMTSPPGQTRPRPAPASAPPTPRPVPRKKSGLARLLGNLLRLVVSTAFHLGLLFIGAFLGDAIRLRLAAADIVSETSAMLMLLVMVCTVLLITSIVHKALQRSARPMFALSASLTWLVVGSHFFTFPRVQLTGQERVATGVESLYWFGMVEWLLVSLRMVLQSI